MIANPPELWMTPAERREYERLDKLSRAEIEAELKAQGCDVEAFKARIRATIEQLRAKHKSQ